VCVSGDVNFVDDGRVGCGPGLRTVRMTPIALSLSSNVFLR
jgi:hypothetical protein